MAQVVIIHEEPAWHDALREIASQEGHVVVGELSSMDELENLYTEIQTGLITESTVFFVGGSLEQKYAHGPGQGQRIVSELKRLGCERTVGLYEPPNFIEFAAVNIDTLEHNTNPELDLVTQIREAIDQVLAPTRVEQEAPGTGPEGI